MGKRSSPCRRPRTTNRRTTATPVRTRAAWGAYCPAPLLDEDALGRIEQDVLVPIVHAMKRGRRPFKGVLYAGLMMTPGGPKVLEFNVRFGDPECQPLLMRLKSDIVEIMLATAAERLWEIETVEFDPRPSICVVMASAGYPGEYEKGRVIKGLEEGRDDRGRQSLSRRDSRQRRRRGHHRRRAGVGRDGDRGHHRGAQN